MKMTSFIGIDLGTTYSAVATIDDTGRPVIVHNDQGENITPSCVVEETPGVMEVGEFARRQWGSAPETAAARFKRDMGTSIVHSINGGEFTPTQLSTFVLKKLFQDTKRSLGNVGEAVVTIPANFAHEARDATMAAAKDAGLDVKYIINEPTAAALYYAFKRDEELSGIYAVYDLGGGTFDISIIRVDGQDVEVMATNGVHKLGGDDFDAALQKLVQRKFKETTGEELEWDDFTKNEAEEEKKSLSKRKQVTVRVAKQMVDIKREEFEEIISTFVTQAEMLCEATIAEAGIDVGDVKDVFIAGGSTRIPIVNESIKKVFHQEPTSSVNVDEVVALGAALYAAYKGDQSKLSTVQQNAIKKIQVSESSGKCFGTISVTTNEARGEMELTNSIIIKKGEKIPCSITQSFYTAYEGQEGINCKVTESTAAETDPRFVNVIWEGSLDLPPNRPENQEIKITFSYDENQVMKCSFVDVGTGKESKVDLTMTAPNADTTSEIDKFVVE
jgi:molecular chaperone DnaK